MTAPRIRFVFPAMKNFREERPTLCWEFIYGWMGGYGLLFDPVVQDALGAIPEWECGWDGRAGRDDFFIACSREASALFGRPRQRGLYVRPAAGVQPALTNRESDKERLITPLGERYYPTAFRMTYDTYRTGVPGWQLGEFPVVAPAGRGLAVGFDLFAMCGTIDQQDPERNLRDVADLLRALLAEAGLPARAAARAVPEAGLRMDCQAYGVNRLFIQWFLDLHGADRAAVAPADAAYVAALAALRRGNATAARRGLRRAFATLAAIRQHFSPLEMQFMEFPHFGLLLEERGYFELEWPQLARDVIDQYNRYGRTSGYRVSLEGGANDWVELQRRFPRLIADVKQACQAGHLELTNGTWSLPYALLSPLALQYWQFRLGTAAFRRLFGRAPATYECQENSLSPQMPELLVHFKYPGALHITQNHGSAPPDEAPFIRWQSPAGYGLPAMTVRDRAFGRAGNNYYLDLPLVHQRLTRENVTAVTWLTAQDLGYIPFRVHMIRAHGYAPVWGRYAVPAPALAAARRAALPARTFTADDYRLSASYFYPGDTNWNALSQYERVFQLTARHRQLQFAVWAAGRYPAERKALDAALPALCLFEAHNICIVSGQRRGEFFAPYSSVPSPYSRDTLSHDIAARAAATACALDDVAQRLHGQAGWFNASGAVLPFARLHDTGEIGNAPAPVAAGPFAPWGVTPAQPATTWTSLPDRFSAGGWCVAAEDTLELAFGGGKAVRCRLVDRRGPAFRLLRSESRRCGPLVHVRLTCLQDGAGLQPATVDVLLHEDHPLAELAVRYAPGRTFTRQNRWEDYLSIEVETGAPFDRVWRFNPNVQAETAEDRVASPCLLAVEPAGRAPLSLLNEGTVLYETDRAAGKVRWLFHVADETKWQRRMALLFGSRDGFELSRAWNQGVLPLTAVRQPLPAFAQGAADVTLETIVDGRTILLSNLRNAPAELEIERGCLDIRDALGKSTVTERKGRRLTATLKPLQLAFLKVK